jgi:crotonobetainyl-CoA:carnitine CoA-transferase CaiB-like acyl-CoA transferase
MYNKSLFEHLPLSGLKVLDATSNIAGPFGGAILADLGAEVIKIETPAGDASRTMTPQDGDRSAYFHIVNRNKSAISIDLKSAEGQAQLKELLGDTDVFLTNFLPERLTAMHLTPDELMKIKPGLIFGNLSSYGSSGPDSSVPGYDATLQGRTGIMHVTGEPHGKPVRAGVSVLDMGSGMWLAIGVLAALVKRAETGLGSVVETSLYETGASWVSYHLAAFQLSGKPSERFGASHPAFGPYGLYQTLDGDICIGVGNDNIFSKLCVLLQREDLITNPQFVTNTSRVANAALLRIELEKVLVTQGAKYWAEHLGRQGVPVDRVSKPEDLLNDLQAQAVEILLPYPDETSGVKKIPGVPIRFNGQRPPIRNAAPHKPN